jgi:DNA mismatch endonuclease (patch repair protein)
MWAVFVNGCFWHHHIGCVRATVPTRNRKYWTEKFTDNQTRDETKRGILASMGFLVVVIWECEAMNLEETRQKLRKLRKR